MEKKVLTLSDAKYLHEYRELFNESSDKWQLFTEIEDDALDYLLEHFERIVLPNINELSPNQLEVLKKYSGKISIGNHELKNKIKEYNEITNIDKLQNEIENIKSNVSTIYKSMIVMIITGIGNLSLLYYFPFSRNTNNLIMAGSTIICFMAGLIILALINIAENKNTEN